MPIDLIYDGSFEEEPSEWGKCIHAPEKMFQVVAGLLFKIATEKPDSSQEKWLRRDLQIDYEMQAALFAFATQCLTGDLCIEGGDMRLRQKPDNDCILQQDQGGEWVDVFDYSLCMQTVVDGIQSIRDDTTIEGINQTPEQLRDFVQDYRDRVGESGTSSDYDPDLTNTDGAGQGAICEALKTVIDNAIDASKTYKQEASDEVTRASLAIGVGVAIGAIAIALISGGVLGPAAAAFFAAYAGTGTAAAVATPLVLGLTIAGLQAWAQAIKDTDAEILSNTEARDAIVCAWYTNLRYNTTVSFSDYSAAIDLTGATSETVALWGAIQPLVQQEAYYVSFLRAWKRSASFASVGIDPECLCEDVPDCALSAINGSVEYMGKVGPNKDKWRLIADGDYYPLVNAIDTLGIGYYVHDIHQIAGTFNFYNSQIYAGGGYFYSSATGDIREPMLTDSQTTRWTRVGIVGAAGSANCVYEVIVSYSAPTP